MRCHYTALPLVGAGVCHRPRQSGGLGRGAAAPGATTAQPAGSCAGRPASGPAPRLCGFRPAPHAATPHHAAHDETACPRLG